MNIEVSTLWSNKKDKLLLCKNISRDKYFLKFNIGEYTYTYPVENPNDYKPKLYKSDIAFNIFLIMWILSFIIMMYGFISFISNQHV